MNTEQERAELLPCPFCGGSVSFHRDDEECREGCHYIECKTCGTFDLSTKADPTNTVEDLGELRARIAPLWNRRAALPTQPKSEFEDPRVQKVYEIICGDNHPPAGEHWDGYVSRLIVDALQSQDTGDFRRTVMTGYAELRAALATDAYIYRSTDIRALLAERDALKHDVEQYVGIASEQATEISMLRATVMELIDAADGRFFGDKKDPDGTLQSVVKAARAALAQGEV